MTSEPRQSGVLHRCTWCGHVHDPEDGRCDSHAHVGIGRCSCPGDQSLGTAEMDCEHGYRTAGGSLVCPACEVRVPADVQIRQAREQRRSA
jgi:hypothetical protein